MRERRLGPSLANPPKMLMWQYQGRMRIATSCCQLAMTVQVMDLIRMLQAAEEAVSVIAVVPQAAPMSIISTWVILENDTYSLLNNQYHKR